MSTDTEIRTTLRHVADGVEKPAVDHLAFDRRVRRHRNRRRAGLTAATAAVAATAITIPAALDHVGSDSESGTSPVAGGVAAPNPPAYFMLDGRPTMLDDQGRVHDLHEWGGPIVDPLPDGVLLDLPDDTGIVMRIRVSDEDGVWRFGRVNGYVVDPAVSAAVSDDGARIAVANPDNELVTYELPGDDELSRTPFGQPVAVEDFADRVLYSVGGSLWLDVGEDAIELPGATAPAAVGGDVVAVPRADGRTHLFDVSSGTPQQIDQVVGAGDLSPDGRYYLAASDASAPVLWERDAGAPRPVTGLEGGAEQVRWLDADTVLVVTVPRGEQQDRWLNACEASTLECEKVFDAGRSDLRILR